MLLRQHVHVAYLKRPLDHGVDIVVHSTTKYLNGHSDGIGGIVVLNNEEDANWIGFIQNGAGAILSPFDSWLVMRGTKTLALRMEQHDKTGRAVAAFLEEHPQVQKVYYPGSASHPQHALARRPAEGFGGWSRSMWFTRSGAHRAGICLSCARSRKVWAE